LTVRTRQHYFIDVKGQSTIPLQLVKNQLLLDTSSVVIIKMSAELEIRDVFYETIDPSVCVNDEDTLKYWNDDPYRQALLQEMPITNKTHRDAGLKLGQWASNEHVQYSATEDPEIDTDNGGYDSRAIANILATSGFEPLRMTLNGGVYGSEEPIDTFMRGMIAAKPDLKILFDNLKKVAEHLVFQLRDVFIAHIRDPQLKAYTLKHWNPHHPVHHTAFFALHSILFLRAVTLN
jgi:hypothetical protein